MLNSTDETRIFLYYTSLIIGLIGIVMNLFNICVSSRSAIQNNNNIGFYNILISLSNILCLTSFVVFYFIFTSETFNMFTETYACKFMPVIGRLFGTISNWLNVMITLDRLFCVYPGENRLNKVNDFLKKKPNLCIVIVSQFLVSCALNVPNLFTHLKSRSELDLLKNQTITIVVCTTDPLIMFTRNLITLLTQLFFPLFLQVIMNVILIYRLFKSRRNVRFISMNPNYRKDRQLAFTIIMQNIVQLIVDLPFFISTLYKILSNNSKEATLASFSDFAIFFPEFCKIKIYRRFTLPLGV